MTFLTIDNTVVYYRISKRASTDAPPVICLHGSGADSIVWSYQISRLSRQFRIIAPDLPGHGKSEGTALKTAEEYACWVDRFTNALNLDTFFLMGHSFGGAIVQEYARLYTHKVQGMILVATGTSFKLSNEYRKLHESGIEVEKFNLTLIPESIRLGYEMLKTVSGPQLHADLLAAGNFDSTGWIGSIKVPALVVWGDGDYITDQDLPENLSRMLPHAQFYIIMGAGHVVMVDTPRQFNEAVLNFMQRHVKQT